MIISWKFCQIWYSWFSRNNYSALLSFTSVDWPTKRWLHFHTKKYKFKVKLNTHKLCHWQGFCKIVANWDFWKPTMFINTSSIAPVQSFSNRNLLFCTSRTNFGSPKSGEILVLIFSWWGRVFLFMYIIWMPFVIQWK